jgi:hypothetical protein
MTYKIDFKDKDTQRVVTAKINSKFKSIIERNLNRVFTIPYVENRTKRKIECYFFIEGEVCLLRFHVKKTTDLLLIETTISIAEDILKEIFSSKQ